MSNSNSPEMDAVRVAVRDGHVTPQSLADERGSKTVGPMMRTIKSCVRKGLLRKIGGKFLPTKRGTKRASGETKARKKGSGKKGSGKKDRAKSPKRERKKKASPVEAVTKFDFEPVFSNKRAASIIAASFFDRLAAELRKL